MLKVIKERDNLIDVLILSHLKSLGRLYSLETEQGLSICRRLVVDLYAKEDIVDEKISTEMHDIFKSGKATNEIMDNLLKDRRPILSKTLTDLARSIRQNSLKRMSEIELTEKY